jgi:tRNA(Ile)-lysidine synthase
LGNDSPPPEPLARRGKKKHHACVTGLLQHIEDSIHKRKLLKRGRKILVAVSGGLDSMVLLHALKNLSARHNWKLSVAHFNHRLRGRASDADEKLVRKTAEAMKLPFAAGRADVKQFAWKSKLSVEMAARKLRHEFFARAARKQKINTIALAHHADDQVELFFLRLLRGAGGEGLAGMKWRSQSPADKKIALVRPLLDFSKNELCKIARENKIVFRDDATNFSSDFLRNRIRNGLLPLLRKNYQPGLNRSVLRLMEILGAESDFVRASARIAGKSDFAGADIAIQRRILQARLAQSGFAPDFDLIERLRGSPGKFVTVGSGLSVSRDANGKLKWRGQPTAEFNASELAVHFARAAGEVNFGGVKFKWRLDNNSRGRLPRRMGREFFDAGKIGGKIILRHWRAGDRFQPAGLKTAAKLQDLFTNAKVPRERRRGLIVAEASDGQIFWVEGLRISENFKISPQTKRQLVWRWRNQS